LDLELEDDARRAAATLELDEHVVPAALGDHLALDLEASGEEHGQDLRLEIMLVAGPEDVAGERVADLRCASERGRVGLGDHGRLVGIQPRRPPTLATTPFASSLPST
jgi:hypothetical protein